jgi:hypothetical protein
MISAFRFVTKVFRTGEYTPGFAFPEDARRVPAELLLPLSNNHESWANSSVSIRVKSSGFEFPPITL